VEILGKMTKMTGVYFTEQQVTSEMRLANCNKVTGKLETFVKHWFASQRHFPVILTYHCIASFD
jgi:hypothetical protein